MFLLEKPFKLAWKKTKANETIANWRFSEQKIRWYWNFIACICSLFPVFSQYFSCLLLIFLIELVAGVLAYVYYQAVSDTLDSIAIKQSSKELTPNCLYDGSSGSTVPDWHRWHIWVMTLPTAHSLFLFISLFLSLLSVFHSWVKSWSSTWARRWQRTMPNLEKTASLNLWTDYSRMWETPNPSILFG